MSVKGMAFHQGNKILLKDAKVGVMTHALHYGTAAFEGIRGNWNSDKNEMVIFRLKKLFRNFTIIYFFFSKLFLPKIISIFYLFRLNYL